MAPGNPNKNNVLNLWGNEKTMNLNSLILTNIQSSHYFKVNLYELKTYHEVIDEIYYKVTHLEPWEKGSRKTSGQTGMCGGVRGVGAGGIVSTAYCLLYKLFTLKLTRKQVIGLVNHTDSPYIRGLGLMYIRYTQAPGDLWDWYEDYLDDDEEIDPKAGGGTPMTVGQLVRNFMTKLEWFSSLFPRIPVPIQKEIEMKLNQRKIDNPVNEETNQYQEEGEEEKEEEESGNRNWREAENPSRERSKHNDRRYDDRDYHSRHDKERNREHDSRNRSSSHRSTERNRHHHNSRHHYDIADEIAKERERQHKEKSERKRHRSRSRERSSHKSKSHKSNGKKCRNRSRSKERSRK